VWTELLRKFTNTPEEVAEKGVQLLHCCLVGTVHVFIHPDLISPCRDWLEFYYILQ